jgi:hypothetical protein
MSVALWIRPVILEMARRVSSFPLRLVRSMLADWMWDAKALQSALCQARRGGEVGVGEEGREREMVIELWSEVVSWSMASASIDWVIEPRERHRSIVEGLLPFRGWWVGIPGLLWRWKLLFSSQLTIEWVAAEVRALWGRVPCHHM